MTILTVLTIFYTPILSSYDGISEVDIIVIIVITVMERGGIMASGNPKNVQIEYDLFWKIVLFFFAEDYESVDYIKSKLEQKLDKMIMHDLYTKYKTADTEEEKEKARKMIKNYVIGLVVIFAILVACPYLVKGIAALIAG